MIIGWIDDEMMIVRCWMLDYHEWSYMSTFMQNCELWQDCVFICDGWMLMLIMLMTLYLNMVFWIVWMLMLDNAMVDFWRRYYMMEGLYNIVLWISHCRVFTCMSMHSSSCRVIGEEHNRRELCYNINGGIYVST